MNEQKPSPRIPATDDELAADLAARLARLRARIETEGRLTAVKVIDAAIERTNRKQRKGTSD
ncbi:MAG: hypothetical protein V4491_01030 [Pseudomonadota bacterium]